MLKYFKNMEKVISSQPEKIAFMYGDKSNCVTYKELDEFSGRICQYLKDNNVKPKDFVMLKFPRGWNAYAAALGVWKAGAAFILCDINMPNERVEFIHNDLNCFFTFSIDEWDKAMSYDYSYNLWPQPDLYDPAFAIYTSGSTGNPKGVLHLYGNIDEMWGAMAYEGEAIIKNYDIAAQITPVTAVASIIALVIYTVAGATCVIIPDDFKKDITRLIDLYEEIGVTYAFFPPSFFRIFKNLNSQLERVFLSSEPAKNVFKEGIDLYNTHAMSESGFCTCVFKMDKAYDATPVGKPQLPGKRVFVADEYGNELPDGEKGELCFESPFVPGYINLPEVNEERFKDGIAHTGDIAFKNENGDFVIVGRKDDMIKIAGNRIEPSEIETAVKKELNIDFAYVKKVAINNASVLCVYYDADIDIDRWDIGEKLSKKLPYYMIPRHYIHIDEIPRLPNGKINRNGFPVPDFKIFHKGEKPVTKLECDLCKYYEEVLNINDCGATDDFFDLGGDSLTAIRLLEKISLLNVDTIDIYRFSTPRTIAREIQRILESNITGTMREQNIFEMNQPHGLTEFQKCCLADQHKSPEANVFNIVTILDLDLRKYRPDKVVMSLNATIRNHPALLAHITKKGNSSYELFYDETYFTPVSEKNMSEKDYLDFKKKYNPCFSCVDHPLYMCDVIVTQSEIHVILNFHHIISDGTSIVVFVKDFFKSYDNEKLNTDYYYLLLSRCELAKRQEDFIATVNYFDSVYKKLPWACLPVRDKCGGRMVCGESVSLLNFNHSTLMNFRSNSTLPLSVIFSLSGLIALSVDNNSSDVLLDWTFNGRDIQYKKDIVGLLIAEIPLFANLKDSMTLSELSQALSEQVEVINRVKGKTAYGIRNYEKQRFTNVIYQGEFSEIVNYREGFKFGDFSKVRDVIGEDVTLEVFDTTEGIDSMCVCCTYCDSFYEKEHMDGFVKIFSDILDLIVNEKVSASTTIKELKEKLKY